MWPYKSSEDKQESSSSSEQSQQQDSNWHSYNQQHHYHYHHHHQHNRFYVHHHQHHHQHYYQQHYYQQQQQESPLLTQSSENENVNRGWQRGGFTRHDNIFGYSTGRAASAQSTRTYMQEGRTPVYQHPYYQPWTQANFAMHAQSTPENMTNVIRIRFTLNNEVHEIKYNGDKLVHLLSPSLPTPPPSTMSKIITPTISSTTSSSMLSLSSSMRTPFVNYTSDMMPHVNSPLSMPESGISSSNSASNMMATSTPSISSSTPLGDYYNLNNNQDNRRQAPDSSYHVLERYQLVIRSLEEVKRNAQVYNDFYELVFTIKQCSNNYGPRNLMAVLQFPWGTRHYLGPLFSAETITSARFVRHIPSTLEFQLCVDHCVDRNSLTPFPSEMLLKEHIKVILDNDEYCGSVSSSNLQNVVRELPFYAEGIKRFRKWSVFVNHFSTHYGCWRLIKYSPEEHKALGLSACTPPNELRLVSNRLASFSTRGDLERDKVKLAAIAEYRDLVVKAHNEQQQQQQQQQQQEEGRKYKNEAVCKRIGDDDKFDEREEIEDVCNESSDESEDDDNNNDVESDSKSYFTDSSRMESTRRRWCKSITSQLKRDKLQLLAASHSLIKLHCINYRQELQRYADTHSILFSPLHPVQVDNSTGNETEFAKLMKYELSNLHNRKRRM